MLVLVTYDIADDAVRTRLAQELENFGQRVNYSVFECHLDPGQRSDLYGRLRAFPFADDDNIRIYPICDECYSKVAVIGKEQVTEKPTFFIV